jgi:UDP-N-acetylglucosamine--N-acetylmuramyl-(pentapeptide) pyrophosphoryl-undecaprenol N-acetylglucosamine transferase
MKLLIAGGGTGGHIFPAIAIANEFKASVPNAQILFVGADGGMEERLVADAGYTIKTIWISGLYRKVTLQNIIRNVGLPVKYVVAHRQASRIISGFEPDIVLGVGGYASYPTLNEAVGKKGILTAIMEQNAFPGLSNRRLAPKVDMIFLGSGAASKHFSNEQEKIIISGNPVRQDMFDGNRDKAIEIFGLLADRPVVLAMGGSLGARTINESVKNHLELFKENGIQLLWQCGKGYYDTLREEIIDHPLIKLYPFIKEMNHAYAAADLVVARAGALTIAEIIALAKPSILIPSPNVADDHQTKNAAALVEEKAALLLNDEQAIKNLGPEVVYLLNHPTRKIEMSANALRLHRGNAAKLIVASLWKKSVRG